MGEVLPLVHPDEHAATVRFHRLDVGPVHEDAVGDATLLEFLERLDHPVDIGDVVDPLFGGGKALRPELPRQFLGGVVVDLDVLVVERFEEHFGGIFDVVDVAVHDAQAHVVDGDLRVVVGKDL
ncbi:hypothetical protein GCM10025789_12590 [Tessaracoccus lubricantis]|uniref:Uncharacterized protein n=1 Tax=Tessaracoccus lubricantis TaxID=545543 RepID=A0ABP9FA59_9ACTN